MGDQHSFTPGAVMAALALAAAAPGAARASGPVAFNASGVTDVMANTQGGLRSGGAWLHQLELGARIDGDAIGLRGFKAQLLYFAAAGDRPSRDLVGDVQALDNIEADRGHRLLEGWVEQALPGGASLRAGLMDVNAEFDAIEPAALFLNSAHGVGSEFASSGVNGPSIYPLTGVGIRAAFERPSLQMRGAVLDGVPGDPDRPGALAAARLRQDEGALVIAQADLALDRGLGASVGAWRYTARFERLGGGTQRGSYGAYGYVHGPLPLGEGWSGWVRVGLADPRTVSVSHQFSGGVVKAAPFAGRPHDRLGLAFSHVRLGPTTATARASETNVELTYLLAVNPWLTLQPNAQYIASPASAPGLADALVLGLRFSVVLGESQ